jgi:hypothetical protein
VSASWTSQQDVGTLCGRVPVDVAKRPHQEFCGWFARRIIGGQDDEIFFSLVEGGMNSVPERDLHNLNSTAKAAPVCFATDLASDRKTLAGITSLIVVIEKLNPAAHALGLMEEGIRNTAEFKLSLAGIRIMPLLPITARYINVHVFQNAATVISKYSRGQTRT